MGSVASGPLAPVEVQQLPADQRGLLLEQQALSAAAASGGSAAAAAVQQLLGVGEGGGRAALLRFFSGPQWRQALRSHGREGASLRVVALEAEAVRRLEEAQRQEAANDASDGEARAAGCSPHAGERKDEQRERGEDVAAEETDAGEQRRCRASAEALATLRVERLSLAAQETLPCGSDLPNVLVAVVAEEHLPLAEPLESSGSEALAATGRAGTSESYSSGVEQKRDSPPPPLPVLPREALVVLTQVASDETDRQGKGCSRGARRRGRGPDKKREAASGAQSSRPPSLCLPRRCVYTAASLAKGRGRPEGDDEGREEAGAEKGLSSGEASLNESLLLEHLQQRLPLEVHGSHFAAKEKTNKRCEEEEDAVSGGCSTPIPKEAEPQKPPPPSKTERKQNNHRHPHQHHPPAEPSWLEQLQRSVSATVANIFAPKDKDTAAAEGGSSGAGTRQSSRQSSVEGGGGGLRQKRASRRGDPGRGDAAEQTAAEASTPEHHPLRSTIGFSFSPAGLLAPYHFGVLSLLCEANVVHCYTPLAGASAGALAAVLGGVGLPLAESMRSMQRLSSELRKGGTLHRIAKVLKKELRLSLPDDAAQRLNARPGSVTVTYTTVFPYLEGQFVRRFYSREDLIECLVASCNIPFYLSSWPTVTCRGRQAVDGYFATKHQAFGCPDTGALRDVKVVPFSAATLRLAVEPGGCIGPDLQEHDEAIRGYLRAKQTLRERLALADRRADQETGQENTACNCAARAATAAGSAFAAAVSSGMQPDASAAASARRRSEGGVFFARRHAPHAHKAGEDRPSRRWRGSLAGVAFEGEKVAAVAAAAAAAACPRCSPLGPVTPPPSLTYFFSDPHSPDFGSGPVAKASFLRSCETPQCPAAAAAQEQRPSSAERRPCSCETALLQLRVGTQELLQMALEPAPPKALEELFDLGRADAFRWLVLEYMRCEEGICMRSSAAASSSARSSASAAKEEPADPVAVSQASSFLQDALQPAVVERSGPKDFVRHHSPETRVYSDDHVQWQQQPRAHPPSCAAPTDSQTRSSAPCREGIRRLGSPLHGITFCTPEAPTVSREGSPDCSLREERPSQVLRNCLGPTGTNAGAVVEASKQCVGNGGARLETGGQRMQQFVRDVSLDADFAHLYSHSHLWKDDCSGGGAHSETCAPL